MFDIGTLELLLVAVVALVVVGPKDLPKLLKSVAAIVRRVRALATEFRMGVNALAEEVERSVDPFDDLRRQEGLHKGMTPEEITEKIMANREAEATAQKAAVAEKEKPRDSANGLSDEARRLQTPGGCDGE